MPESDPMQPVASSLTQVVGALIFSSPVPIDADAIRKCLKDMPDAEDGTKPPFRGVSVREVQSAILDIQQDLERLGLGVALEEVAGGYRFQTQAGCGRWVRALLKKDKPALLSRPSLETLAIIAYRQPVARSEIEGIRGVAVDHSVRQLMELHLVRIVGRSDLPGRPFLYGTTPLFLEHFGLKDLAELKEIDPTLGRRESKPPELPLASSGASSDAVPEAEVEGPKVEDPKVEETKSDDPMIERSDD
ncbi:MAG: SMC-Scp complex subunit ScpB [Kiritimatiellae bacterium]|nr:SMC-Scp complex subunit ScpB [Kiritimatiellia bacterium]